MLQPEIATELDKFYGPIVDTFTIKYTPDGGAPLEIREQWVDIQLPFRARHAKRLFYGYVGRRFDPLPEDSAMDALTGERPTWPIWSHVEIRGYDAVETLRVAGRLAAVEFWTPYQETLLGFDLWAGHFGAGNTEAPTLPK